MTLTKQEEDTLISRQKEFKCLSKKSVYLSYLFLNLKSQKEIVNFVNVFTEYNKICKKAQSEVEFKSES